MGVVYLAEQEKPIHRRVALKLIKLGMDTKNVVARFETEREALALMNHPNIAKVLDAGATDTGRPYFIMEYVPGIAITDYCDRQRSTTEERLKLFIELCHAVHHAHQKGIIHRDLKPSNLLVAVHDGQPVPKIIDFGVAKATQHRLTERTVFTEQGQMIGTPGYMSPEQAEMSALDIDTRSDIYSLGVVLYELLVGALPFDNKTLLQGGFAEIQRIIREVVPAKPSTRLSSLGVDSSTVAQRRGTEIKSLIRQVRGDLDWIVMKCLEKDRARRYDSASNLAQDIERHLQHLPVLAGPPSTTYRFSRFARRHRTGLAVSAGVVTVVVASVSFAAVSYFRSARVWHASAYWRYREVSQLMIGQMGPYKHAIHFFKQTTGQLPQELDDLIRPPSNEERAARWRGPLMHDSPEFGLDSWGHRLRYRAPGVHHPDAYDLWSVGPDGMDDTGDELNNWECPMCSRQFTAKDLF